MRRGTGLLLPGNRATSTNEPLSSSRQRSVTRMPKPGTWASKAIYRLPGPAGLSDLRNRSVKSLLAAMADPSTAYRLLNPGQRTGQHL